VHKVDDIRETLVAIDGLLGWGFLSEPTRLQLEKFKAELLTELRFLLDQQSDVAAAS
jgi:hypothetical protein